MNDQRFKYDLTQMSMDPAIVIPLWFQLLLTQTIVTASPLSGITFPGIIDEPGSFSGKIIHHNPL